MDTLEIPAVSRGRTGTIRGTIKGKPAPSLSKALPPQQDQMNKLQVKTQQDIELLDEVRNYMKLRAGVEAEYAANLQKITQQALAKRKWTTPKLPKTDVEYRTVLAAWKSLLDDSLEMAKARAGISEKIGIMIVDPIRPQHKQKQAVTKKGLEHGVELSEEIAVTFEKVDKAKKAYQDLERVAAVAREKFNEIDARSKKKLRIFESKADVEKKLERAEKKKDLCERRAQTARHDYMLGLAMANGHHAQYYRRDLPALMAMLDGDFYSQLQNYFTAYGTIMQEAIAEEHENAQDIKKEAALVDREFECKVFVLEHPQEFTEPPPLEFKPLESDRFTTMILDANSRPVLHKEMQKMVNHIAKAQKVIEQKSKEMASVQSMIDVYVKQPQFGTPEAQADAELQMEKFKDTIRQMQLQQLKAQARLDVMVAAGFRLEDFKASVEDEPDSGAKGSLKTSSRRSSFASMTSAVPTPRGQRCRAIYDYKAQASDELNLEEDEVLKITEPDQDGWMKGENSKGMVGIFPTSYVEIISADDVEPSEFDDEFDDDDNASLPSLSSVSSAPPAKAPSSVASAAANHYHSQPAAAAAAAVPAFAAVFHPPATTAANQYSQQSAARTQQQPTQAAAAKPGRPPPPKTTYVDTVRALYDNEGEDSDDLSFVEGDIINVISKSDDDFWVGELNGRRGTFPSMLVESCNEDSSV
ncbi:hypothetical protein CAOG_04916 [Capsaspora owczarzaki ATCC 30864]|uniref:Uncharacterized protein n=1 Tax=Capsaspora owczarzaki (strain ATCC 30864) TaxID=595528 RepID=A0A0D2X3G0_CAPO3|nr:hypothetical protein CAOG_04916 [Capsaspora owczarzaki ATCC 30864]KJE94244.1 hypothetical protein, variant 1 [Capsaspora owczarzaki ATCC 30864]|eukprot:XP_004347667.2 hypothetical protein CAOG_04916 [Capsaspora owczarzaki ATCC 30864]